MIDLRFARTGCKAWFHYFGSQTDRPVSYTHLNDMTKRMGLNNLTVNMSVNNLFVIASKRFDGYDPELQDSVMPKNYSIGINIGF